MLQIPSGAMPVNTGFFTKTTAIKLKPYSTATPLTYHFYFPTSTKPGTYAHFPAHISQYEKGTITPYLIISYFFLVVAFAEPFIFNVVDEPTKIDKTSWHYVSNNVRQSN
jgi:hypothetical protein